jgi:pyridoxal phosphate enzyme (YggS family)
MTTDIAVNYRRIRERMEAAALRVGRDPRSVRFVAVTKTVSPERIREAIECGVTEIGENRLQEGLSKRESLSDLNLAWHFIGHLQTNKAKKVVGAFDWVHSVDRIDLAEKLDQAATSKRLPILIEVNLGGEQSKSGVAESQLQELVEALRAYSNLELCGLMTVPPMDEDPESVRPYFKRLTALCRRYDLRELSMGMSNDFEVAIEEGATMIRVGTALFGRRA